MVLAEQARSRTDLALGVVTLVLGVRLRRLRVAPSHWRVAFRWFGAAALAGAVQHGVTVRWQQAAVMGWRAIGVMVVVAVSYVLAGTLAEALRTGFRRSAVVFGEFSGRMT